MANTTDLMITCLFDDDAIAFINSETGLDFKLISDGTKAGGDKISSISAFGTCPRAISREKTQLLVNTFKKATFEYPHVAVLLIDSDDDYGFNGTVVLETD